jgi:hypothetical protein
VLFIKTGIYHFAIISTLVRIAIDLSPPMAMEDIRPSKTSISRKAAHRVFNI